MTIETYQCPQCSAPLIWKNGELVCESCGASYKEEDMRALSEAMQENAGQSSLDWNKCRNAQTFTAQEESALQEYNCPACGAVLVTSAATAATKCAYCGNNALIRSCPLPYPARMRKRSCASIFTAKSCCLTILCVPAAWRM